MSGQRAGGRHGHVFVSYVREDRGRVDRLQAILEGAGISVWRDTASIWPGQDWRLEIRDAIRGGSLAFVACFSENSERKESSYQNEELVLAVEQMRVRHPGGLWLIPVRFAVCSIPAFDLGAGRTLDALQHVDLFDGTWEQGVPRILGAVHRILDGAPTPRPGPASGRADAQAGAPSRDVPASAGGRQGPADASRAEDLAEMYNRGLAALYTERWDEAVQAFLAVAAEDPYYKDSALKLEQARQGQRIPSLYAAACEAADAGGWGEALEQFEAVEAAEPGYRDVLARLEEARREHAQAEVAELHRAGRWQDVVDAADRLQAISPGDPDPDGLITSALAELAAADRARVLAEAYQRALHHIGAGEWAAASVALAFVVTSDPGYEHAAQLADRVRRELVRSAPLIKDPALVSVLRSGERFLCLDFSPDDTRLAAGSEKDVSAVVMDLGGREQFRLRHNAPRREYNFMHSVAFDCSGRRLLTAGSDDTIRIWDAVSGTQRLKITNGEYAAHAAFSPDGTMIARAGDDVAAIWDTGSGKEILRLGATENPWSKKHARDVVFSPDGRKLATMQYKAVQIWDISSGKQVLELEHPNFVKGIAFSPDGSVLATGCEDAIARIWNISNGEKFLELAHSRWMYSVAFSPDGRVLAVASAGSIWFWDWITGDRLFRTPAAGIIALAFSHSGRFVAAAGNNNDGLFQLYLWRLAGDTLTP
jgi:hypothetical protein